jgi:hypothetical protein
MNNLQPSPIQPLVAREKIVTLETEMKEFNRVHGLPEPDCPLTHHFAPGAYGREIFLPKDSLVVGKIYKHAHLNMIMQGHVSVATEDGVQVYHAPIVMVSKPGTKRVVYAHEDTIWVTVHLTQETDLAKIEDEIIAKTFAEYDAFAGIHLPSFLAVIEHESQKELL